VVSQEKITFLLPILAPDSWLKWLQRCTSAPACVQSIIRLEWLERYTRETVPHWYGAATPWPCAIPRR